MANNTTTAVTFSSISGSYSALKIILQAATDSGSGTTNLLLTLNSDTGSNYVWAQNYGSNSTASGGGGSTSDTSATIALITGDTNEADSAEITISNYAGTVFNKSLTAITTAQQATYSFSISFAGIWRNTSAITSVTLTLASGHFLTGSTFVLYGLV